jgi:membrane-bound metal-dependent hydrolase YbcI (DUF457 family)
MFIGHDAIAFAGKKAAPRTSLGTLIAAASLLDLIWPVLVIAGVERFEIRPGVTSYSPFDFTYYPWSHSLVMSIVWSIVFGAGYFAITKYARGAVVTGVAVFSHWVLDFVTHRADMPLWFGGPKVGLGLWNSIPGTIIVESLIYIAGVAIYLRSTRARDRMGVVLAWFLIIFLGVMYIASSMNPPAPGTSPVTIAWGAQAVWLLIALGWWADRHREARA